MISYPSTKPISGAVFTNMKSALATYMMALQVKYKVRLLPVADVCELSPDTDEVLSVAHSDLRPFWSYDAPKEAANGDNEDIEMAEDEIVPGSVDKGDANEQVVAIYRYKALQQAIDAASCYSTCSLTVGDIIKAETKVLLSKTNLGRYYTASWDKAEAALSTS
ncbi:hypothetical protein BGZ83_012082 [Gryganskiella cystojenkinii]|nr:hypothetical protein BGZ83_012082 [Gryganskiella cystojenkinii]